MENIQLLTPDKELTDFMSLEHSVAKNIAYYNKISGRNYEESNICKKDDLIHYSYNTIKVMKSKNSYYFKRMHKEGFTIDEKGKLKIWFGKSVLQLPGLNLLFKHYNFNWFDQKLYPYLTKTILEKMFAGKITNNLDVVKTYFKLMRIDASPNLFLKMIGISGISKQDFLRQIYVAKDTNHLIEYYTTNQEHDKHIILNDMIQQAQILEKKIDFKWSINRLKEEHKAWTNQIMEEELKSLDDNPVPNIEKFESCIQPGIILLKSQKEVFQEGKTMHHCVYTNYWNSILNGTYLAYHIDFFGEQATLGVNVFIDSISMNQCYSTYNKPISEDLRKYAVKFVEKLNDHYKLINSLTKIK
jgi:hypothetical protein